MSRRSYSTNIVLMLISTPLNAPSMTALLMLFRPQRKHFMIAPDTLSSASINFTFQGELLSHDLIMASSSRFIAVPIFLTDGAVPVSDIYFESPKQHYGKRVLFESALAMLPAPQQLKALLVLA